MEQDSVECGQHGTARAAYVCQHLAAGEGLGFFWGEDSDEPNELCPDAWCGRCDELLEARGEWDDEASAFAGITVICAECYVDVRARNWCQDDDAFDAVLAGSLEELSDKQARLWCDYDLDRWERWDWSLDTDELVFSHEGERKVVSHMAVVGTQSVESGTWMWAWGNRGIPDRNKRPLAPVRELGERENYMKLCAGYWRAEEEDGWAMTAIACRVLEGIGGYRTPTDTGHIYMVILDAERVA